MQLRNKYSKGYARTVVFAFIFFNYKSLCSVQDINSDLFYRGFGGYDSKRMGEMTQPNSGI